MAVSETTIIRRLKKGWTVEAAMNTPAQNAPADLTGRRFGHLVPVRVTGKRGDKPGARHIVWLCQCDCGRTTEVTANNLRTGSTKTCGCRLTKLKTHGLTHGHVRGGLASPTYRSWLAMLSRCFNAKNTKYRYYGGRGITVCPEWRSSFEAFLDAMGPRPSGKTLDRIDPNGHYAPDNCRWATRLEQARNQRPRTR